MRTVGKSTLFLIVLAASFPPFASADLTNETAAGITSTSGNSQVTSINLTQLNGYSWEANTFKLSGRYLLTSNEDIDTANNWGLGLRYERTFHERFSGFVAQGLEANTFAGILQNYITDLGGKYVLLKDEIYAWSIEGGYRYSLENRTDGDENAYHLLRAYSDLAVSLEKNVTAKFSAEYLPNLTESENWQFNSEAALISALSEFLSLKVGYLLKYRNLLIPGAKEKTDTVFTTALVAKW